MKIIDKLLVKGLTNKPLKSVKGIVIHWVANPKSTALNNIKYWENLASGVATKYIIDLDGTIYNTVKGNMMTYHTGKKGGYTKSATERLSAYPNDCTIGIECTHIDDKGRMTKETLDSLEWLSAKLLKDHKLQSDDLWLHSEIVGKDYKDCHRWFTTTKPSDWIKFKKDVHEINHPKPKPKPKPKATHTHYSVRLGDTLSGIAKKHKVAVGEVLEINPQIKNRNQIFVNDVLNIPLK